MYSTVKSLQEYMDLYQAEHQKTGTRVTHFFGIPMIVASLPMFLKNKPVAASLFVLGWGLQALGHHIEGNRPAFFRDPIYLLVGPLWVARELLQCVVPESPRGEG